MKWRLIWTAYWAGIGVIASLVSYRLGWVPHRTGTIFDISSGFSPYLRSLIERFEYVDCQYLPGTCRTTMRLPGVPFFHFALSFLVGRSVFVHLLVKNVLAAGLCAYAVHRLCRRLQLGVLAPFIILGLMYFNPVGFRILPTLGGEEAYYVPLLVLLLVELAPTTWTTRGLHTIGAILAALCLIKSTLTLVALAVVLYVAASSRAALRSFVPAAYVVVALGSWSAWSHATTGRWTHVVNISAYDGINFFKGNNEHVDALYPDVHLDVLDTIGYTDPPVELRSSEWAVSDYFRGRALEYLSADTSRAVRFVAFKIAAPFLLPNSPARIYVKGEATFADLPQLEQQARSPTTKSRIISVGLWLYKMIWLASLLFAIWQVWLRNSVHAHAGYLIVSVALAVPFAVGFAYTNHLAVLYTLMIVQASWLVAWRRDTVRLRAVAAPA